MRLKPFLALLTLVAAPLALAQTPPPKYVTGQIIVKFKPSTPITTMQSVHSRVGSVILKEEPTLKFQTVRLRTGYTVPSAVSYYKSSPYVQYAHANAIYTKRADVDDPMKVNQGSLGRMNVFNGWDLNQGIGEVKVPIIDTGIDMEHPDLKPKIVNPFDQANNDNYPQDFDIHGTHVAGLAAAATNNGIGIAGVGYNARIMPISFDFTAAGSAESIIRATQKGAKVINMSYGGYGLSEPEAEKEALDYAISRGVICVAAAGNDNTQDPFFIGFPAGHPGVVTVGATLTINDNRAVFSNYGHMVEVTAPGDGATPYSGVLSTLPGNGYGYLPGTSMASPNVAGLVALLWSRSYMMVTSAEIKQALFDQCDPIGLGIAKHGRVNAFKALQATRRFDKFVESTTAVFGAVHEGVATTSSANIGANDGVYFSIDPVVTPSVGKVASAYYDFAMPINPTQILSLKVTVDSRFAVGSTTQVFAFNNVTSKWEHLKSIAATDSADRTVVVVIGTGKERFVNGDGDVRLMVRGVWPTAYWTETTPPYSVDYVQFETTWVEEIFP